MHRATLAPADALVLAVDLLHHALHVAAFGDGVTVAAVGAGDVVVAAQVSADSGGDSFLARVEVYEARDVTRGELGVQPLLELSNGPHHPVCL